MIDLFSSCPRSNRIARSRFLDCVAGVARWSERELDRYLTAGHRALVVDVPADPEDLDHVQAAFARTPTLAAGARGIETAAAS